MPQTEFWHCWILLVSRLPLHLWDKLLNSKRLLWLPVLDMYHLTRRDPWLSPGLIVLRRWGPEKAKDRVKPLYLTFQEAEFHWIQGWLMIQTSGWYHVVYNAAIWLTLMRPNDVADELQQTATILNWWVLCVHAHHLCTWYSEGLQRRRSEEAPGWGSEEDRGYTPQARWYLQYRTERRLCKTRFESIWMCYDENKPRTAFTQPLVCLDFNFNLKNKLTIQPTYVAAELNINLLFNHRQSLPCPCISTQCSSFVTACCLTTVNLQVIYHIFTWFSFRLISFLCTARF